MTRAASRTARTCSTTPTEKANFKTKYGYDLDAPETWKQYYDIAEFFTRPEKGLYGCAIYTQKDYDALTMGVETVLFSYGVNWQDEKNRVIGRRQLQPRRRGGEAVP